MEIDKLKKYINDLKSNNTIEALTEKVELLELAKSDEELKSIMKNIEGRSYEESLKIIDEYENSVKLKNKTEEKEVISAVFGVNVEDIEHKFLKSGTEIFAFYDKDYARKRILEKPDNDLSLVEFLKKIQNENIKYQGESDFKENANSIMKDEINKSKYEKEMIYIDEIHKYSERINGLEDEQKRALNFMINHKEEKKIKYINIEDCFALDDDGKIIESFIDEKTNKAIMESPEEYKYNVDEVDNKEETENLDEEQYNEETEKYNISSNEFEDIPEIMDPEFKKNYLALSDEQRKVIINNIKDYYNHPEKMEKLPELEKNIIMIWLIIIQKKLNKKNKLIILIN